MLKQDGADAHMIILPAGRVQLKIVRKQKRIKPRAEKDGGRMKQANPPADTRESTSVGFRE